MYCHKYYRGCQLYVRVQLYISVAWTVWHTTRGCSCALFIRFVLLVSLQPSEYLQLPSPSFLPSFPSLVVFHGLVHHLCWHKCCFSLPVICAVSHWGSRFPECAENMLSCVSISGMLACEHAYAFVGYAYCLNLHACVILVICEHTSWLQSVRLGTYSAWVFIHASLCKRVCVSANIIGLQYVSFFWIMSSTANRGRAI